mgnify:CR=1 FL=1
MQKDNDMISNQEIFSARVAAQVPQDVMTSDDVTSAFYTQCGKPRRKDD